MLKTIDLFAGAGGLSLGFQLAGKFKILAAAEIDKNARATYSVNIAKKCEDFTFIDNVVGYDFTSLKEKLGGIDVIIGGPPCQGFSNANRQKKNLVCMNNDLIKEYFRAIKEIQPEAFIMENVSSLRSDTHRFYESYKDEHTINELRQKGYKIPKRRDVIRLGKSNFEGIDFADVNSLNFDKYLIPEDLFKLLNVLNKNILNAKRLPNFLEKQTKRVILLIDNYCNSYVTQKDKAIIAIISRLEIIKGGLLNNIVANFKEEIEYIVALHKLFSVIQEIHKNRIIGDYTIDDEGFLVFTTHSYSVIDYINAILNGEYVQVGDTLNAKWFGVPQERKRYIVMGIRKEIHPDVIPKLPKEPKNISVPTVDDAILDLQGYDVGYEFKYEAVTYWENDTISEYAKTMRTNSTSVKNHITTKTTDTAMKRFKVIKPGENFHSLSIEMKSSYTKPERTQNTIYLRLHPDEPSGTVVNVRKSMWIHPKLDRAISVREAARLQSFPDYFEFMGTKDSQYQQVGNAVPPLLAKGIAEHLLSIIR